MFEDIIKPKSTGGFHWDWDEYEKKPYCPTCNSKNLRNTKDLLKDKKLTNWKICEDCGQEWKEVFNEDLELELTEAVLTI
jgi:transcription elongation factor Elf1